MPKLSLFDRSQALVEKAYRKSQRALGSSRRSRRDLASEENSLLSNDGVDLHELRQETYLHRIRIARRWYQADGSNRLLRGSLITVAE